MKKLSTLRTIILTGLTLLPLTVFAQTSLDAARGIGTLAGLIEAITQTVIKSMATLLLSLALLAFFYGIVEYIWAKRKGDASGVKNGGEFMKWGLLALFVMFSVYGIIKFAQSTLFGTTDMTTITIPNIQFKPGTSADLKVGASASPGNVTGVGNPSAASSGNVPVYSGYPQYTTGSAVNTQTSLKNLGEGCNISADCLSNYCNRQGNCAVLTNNSNTGLGEGCVLNADCSSNYCNRQGMCATPVTTNSSASNGSGLPEGSACGGTDYTPCANGLVCTNGQCLRPQTSTSNGNVGDPCAVDGSYGTIDASGNCAI